MSPNGTAAAKAIAYHAAIGTALGLAGAFTYKWTVSDVNKREVKEFYERYTPTLEAKAAAKNAKHDAWIEENKTSLKISAEELHNIRKLAVYYATHPEEFEKDYNSPEAQLERAKNAPLRNLIQTAIDNSTEVLPNFTAEDRAKLLK